MPYIVQDTYAINTLGKYTSNPVKEHRNAFMRILWYLKDTFEHELHFLQDILLLSKDTVMQVRIQIEKILYLLRLGTLHSVEPRFLRSENKLIHPLNYET